MMKREALIVIFAIFIISGGIHKVHAADEEAYNWDATLGGPYSSLAKYSDVITNEEMRSDYLKREWKKILNNSAFGPIMTAGDNTLTFLNPAFKILIGMEYIVSWLFVFTLILYIVLVKMGFDLAAIVKIYSNQEKANIIYYAVLAVFLIFISTIRIARYVSQGAVLFLYSKDFSFKGLMGMIIFLALIVLEALIMSFRSSIKQSKREHDIKEVIKENKLQKKKNINSEREKAAEKLEKEEGEKDEDEKDSLD